MDDNQAAKMITAIFNNDDNYDFWTDPSRDSLNSYGRGQLNILVNCFNINYEIILCKLIEDFKKEDLISKGRRMLSVIKKELSEERKR